MRRIISVAVFVLGTVVAFVGIKVGLGDASAGRVARERDSRPARGAEVVLIYITDPACGVCQDESLDSMILDAKGTLRQAAKSRGLEFASMGVIITDVSDSAWKEAERFGGFDELIVGRWGNIATLKYVWQTLPGKALTPQAVVVEREFVGPPDPTYTIHNERVIARIYGLAELRRWQDARFPVVGSDGPG